MGAGWKEVVRRSENISKYFRSDLFHPMGGSELVFGMGVGYLIWYSAR